jgi:hypothetical protein
MYVYWTLKYGIEESVGDVIPTPASGRFRISAIISKLKIVINFSTDRYSSRANMYWTLIGS